jgi:hypothetical protein
MKEEELLDLMLTCNSAQLNVVEAKLNLNLAFLHGQDAPIATRATGILQLVKQAGDPGIAMLETVLSLILASKFIDVDPLYQKWALSFREMTVATIGCYLSEWKIVHTKSQKLLMNIPEQFVRSINQESTDKDINILSHVWYKNCGKITRDIKISFINFKFIRSISVTMLV